MGGTTNALATIGVPTAATAAPSVTNSRYCGRFLFTGDNAGAGLAPAAVADIVSICCKY